jgi:hypothetical protein
LDFCEKNSIGRFIRVVEEIRQLIRCHLEFVEKVLIVIGALIPNEREDKGDISGDARCHIELRL